MCRGRRLEPEFRSLRHAQCSLSRQQEAEGRMTAHMATLEIRTMYRRGQTPLMIAVGISLSIQIGSPSESTRTNTTIVLSHDVVSVGIA